MNRLELIDNDKKIIIDSLEQISKFHNNILNELTEKNNKINELTKKIDKTLIVFEYLEGTINNMVETMNLDSSYEKEITENCINLIKNFKEILDKK